MSRELDPTIACLDGVIRAGNRANIQTVAKLVNLDRNLVGKTLFTCRSFGMVQISNLGRSEIVAATSQGRLFNAFVHGRYEEVARRLDDILGALVEMPETIEAEVDPVKRAYRRNMRGQNQVKIELLYAYLKGLQKALPVTHEDRLLAARPGVRFSADRKSMRDLLDEMDEIGLALRLANENLGPDTPEGKLANEIRELLSRSDAVIPSLSGTDIKLVIPKATLVVAMNEAIRLLRTAADIENLAKELEFEEVKYEQVGVDGKGRPIFRTK